MTVPSTRPRVVLLTIQTFMLGLMLAFVVIPANAIFLAEYGSAGLAYTYLGMAAVGVPSSMVLAAALRRWRLPLVASSAVALSTALFFGSWLALRADLVWVSAILLVLFIVVLQTGFVLVGGQAGRLFDVRQIKALFPRVISGFVAGLLGGGLLGPVLLAAFGGTEDMLLGATVAGVLFLLAVIATGRRYAPELALIPQPVDVPRPPMRTLIGKRFVVAILVYQVFSAMGSQLLDFMVFDRAAALYTSSEEIAQVVSIFTAALNGTNLLFLAFVAGPLLRRFGLRLGVNANPMLVSALVAMIVATSLLGGTVSFALFLLVAGSRIADLTLSDGMTRTSINATYQALPLSDRLAVQATVEGVGVPVAIGSAGVILIVADLLDLGFTFVAVTTLLLCLVWTGAGVTLYRGYRTRLVGSLRQRAVEPEALVVDGPTLAALDGLLATGQIADVRLALDTLGGAGHDGLLPRLVTLADDPRPELRAEAIRRLGALEDPGARARVRSALDDPDADTALAALLATLRSPVGVAGSQGPAGLGHEVRADETTYDAGGRLAALAVAPDPADRLRLARALGSLPAGPAGAQEVAIVTTLAADRDPAVRAAAMTAAGTAGDPVLLPVAVGGLADGVTASAALGTLPAFGDALVRYTDDVLAGRLGDQPTAVRVRLVRACSALPGAAPMLAGHVDHVDPSTRRAVVLALTRLRREHEAVVPPEVEAASRELLGASAVRAARCLAALAELGGAPGTEHVVRALRDELADAEASGEAALALRYDARAIARAARALRMGAGPDRALAQEMLEVTLDADDRGIALPLLQTTMDDAERLSLLARRLPPAPRRAGAAAVLEDLVLDADGAWQRPWLRTCAVHAIGLGAFTSLRARVDALVAEALPSDPDLVATAHWARGRLGLAG